MKEKARRDETVSVVSHVKEASDIRRLPSLAAIRILALLLNPISLHVVTC